MEKDNTILDIDLGDNFEFIVVHGMGNNKILVTHDKELKISQIFIHPSMKEKILEDLK